VTLRLLGILMSNQFMATGLNDFISNLMHQHFSIFYLLAKTVLVFQFEGFASPQHNMLCEYHSLPVSLLISFQCVN